MTARGLIIGAPRSGSGKTSVTIGILRALSRRCIRVGGAKSGPDYIDPGFHHAATGRPGVNLDSWAMSPALLNTLAADAANSADLLFIESAMGLFDGIPGPAGRSGSAADLARLYGLPVLLVLDVSGQSQTAAAIAKGFATYDPAVRIAGVVLNRLGSDRHKRLAGEAIEALGLPVVGAILRDSALSLPERHLGLVQAGEHADLMAHLDILADMAERSLDLDAIISLMMPLAPSGEDFADALPPPGQRIALAQDAAFTFLYPHVASHWRKQGAEIMPFSPLADEAPPPDCDVCWLPGGYPELHAGRLASAHAYRAGMEKFAATKPVHGECGGFMALGEALEDATGVTHRMLGLLGHSTSFARRKMHLGYRQATLLADCPIGLQGSVVRGHEFHYAQITTPGTDAPLAALADGQGNALGEFGGRRGNVTGTFFHAIAKG
ncbi:cobyrinate a,c-diamide synthase [Pseudaminobacter arsenicus]|uniref:Hydrogenobyrinate a,c-diamide synthase n=1 Tax=Borborobacter arsenicus TaxID=1851146 RepID=A0A432VC63_9HYPH|nr:cobyrinate a,c-diamide synthase [Pseudaminobacter arsenicus]RUM99714.1 cobyrinate a,c-diamide synthase [Pseudaminobacter arsenicus]